MLTINNQKISIKKAEISFKIVNNIKKAFINIETYLGIANDYMDTIYFEIELNRVLEPNLYDLEFAVFCPYNLNIKKIYTDHWIDRKIKEAELSITAVKSNILDITLDIKGENEYHIDTKLEATWFIGKANLSNEKNLIIIDQFHNIDDIELIPFIEDTKPKTIKYAFKKNKENIIWK